MNVAQVTTFDDPPLDANAFLVSDVLNHAEAQIALPRFVDGAASSDHLSFWNAGYPALMASDTAYFRYRWYHTPQDTPERLDYSRMARVVEGLQRVIEHWASAD